MDASAGQIIIIIVSQIFSRVEHSHWSTFTDWWNLTTYAGAKVYVKKTQLKASKMPPTRGILCLSVCLYGMMSGFHAQKESIIFRHPYAIKTQQKAMRNATSCVSMA